MGAVIGRQLPHPFVQCEARVGDAIGKATDEGAHGRHALQHLVKVVVAQHDVMPQPVTTLHLQLQQACAVVADGSLQAPVRPQSIQGHLMAIELAGPVGRVLKGVHGGGHSRQRSRWMFYDN
jgi:hypothetical protein